MPDEGYAYGNNSGNVTVERYDWYDRSKMAIGGEHHAYPVYFITTFYERMNERKIANGETDGFYVLSRGGGIGSQRNSFLWAGDQARAFVKLDDQLMSVVTSGLSGVPNMSYDMAGYRYNGGGVAYSDANSWIYESEMMARAVEFTAFMVNIQTHGTVRNIYELSDGAQEIYRIYTKLHNELSDYITKYMTIASETGIPAVRHPVLEYQSDVNVYSINDQFLLGEGLMVAPILAQNTFERTVYLPEGSWTNLLTGEIMEGGKAYTVSANIGQVPVFLNNDSADAEELLEIFNGDNWQKVVNWNAPLDSTAAQA
jgi:alpha-glucosidase